MESYYKAMPERFYSQSGLPVITPDNVKDWVDIMLRAKQSADFAELFSGSSGLSLSCLDAGIRVAFPADFR